MSDTTKMISRMKWVKAPVWKTKGIGFESQLRAGSLLLRGLSLLSIAAARCPYQLLTVAAASSCSQHTPPAHNS